jgi:hypothetical protein
MWPLLAHLADQLPLDQLQAFPLEQPCGFKGLTLLTGPMLPWRIQRYRTKLFLSDSARHDSYLDSNVGRTRGSGG